MAASAQRPGWFELVGVLAGCAVLLALLVKLDRAAYEREMARARAVLAERAREAAHRPDAVLPAVPRAARPSRIDSPGRGPIPLPLGRAWGAGTTAAVRHRSPAAPRPSVPELRRIVGPGPAPAAAAPQWAPPARPVALRAGRRGTAANGSRSARPKSAETFPPTSPPSSRVRAKDARSIPVDVPPRAGAAGRDAPGDRPRTPPVLVLLATAGALMALAGAALGGGRHLRVALRGPAGGLSRPRSA